MDVSIQTRSRLIKATILVAFVAGCIMSPRLWINHGRSFPLIPPFDGMYTPPTSINLLFMSLFIVLGIAWIFHNRPALGYLAVGSILFVVVQDQMRWQPWVYLYLLMLLSFLATSKDGDENELTIISLQYIIAGVYIWSGIQKMNSNFLDGVIFQVFKESETGLKFEFWKKAGYAIPIIEFAIGLALLIRRSRKIAVFAAVAMHIIILTYLSAVGRNVNSVVIPWNIAMIVLVFLLFWNLQETTSWVINGSCFKTIKVAPLVLVWIFPILNLFGYWDHYLSFSFYSNKPSNFLIAIEESQISKIDARFKNYFIAIPGLRGGQMIEVNKWAFSELNVPFYPEMRLFRKLSSVFCELDVDDDKLVFLELSKANGSIQSNRFTCKELKWTQSSSK